MTFDFQGFTENKVREYLLKHGKIDKDDWCKILAHQKLSENFILEFFDKVNWNLISVYQKFSENFIEEFRDKAN